MADTVRVESPHRGRETEFFLQKNARGAAACTAHIHSAVELLYIESGEYAVTLDGARYDVGAGDLLLFCSGTVHSVLTGPRADGAYYVIKTPPTVLLDPAGGEAGARYCMRFALCRAGSRVLWRREEVEASPLYPILSALVDEYRGARPAAEIAIRARITELLVAIIREDGECAPPLPDAAARLVYRVMCHVSAHYAEDLDEQAIAAELGISYSYLSRSFRRVTGMTFKKYLNRTRIARAEQMLLTGDAAVSEVAGACGYNSVSYFISVFRSLTGKTPRSTRG